ncbi:MAG: type I restriction endonuclease [Thermomicrobiales bacterium]
MQVGSGGGDPHDHDRLHVLDWAKLLVFLRATQPMVVESFDLEHEGPSREQFLSRLQGQIASRGIVDVLRKGVKHQWAQVTLFYGTPTPGNDDARIKHVQNIFSVTRQVRYSPDEQALALDLVLFINGLPVATFELKNNLTKQPVDDAIRQYREDRSPQEPLFQVGRCLAHFAVDEHEVWFCTQLTGKKSWFLPFNKGYKQGKGNPPNPEGLQTAYLWEEVLERSSLTNIIEKYAQLVTEEEGQGAKKRTVRRQIFPRYHQLDVVRNLLADAQTAGTGRRYLIQHSAGSGKSNSIAWLAHQLVELKRGGQPLFDSIIVVTDRIVLDSQLKTTIKQFTQVNAIFGHADHSSDLKKFLEDGKKIVSTTIQKFPFVLDEIQGSLSNRSFALIIDEAHSGQGGSATRSMSRVLGQDGEEEEDDQTIQDRINAAIESRKMLKNADSYRLHRHTQEQNAAALRYTVHGRR